MRHFLPRLLPLLLLLILPGCSSSSKTGEQASPVIYDFHPARANVNPGTSTLLLANFAGGSGQVDQGIGAITSGVPVTISPTATTTYTLTVKGASGTPASASTTITVGAMSVAVAPAQVNLLTGQTQTFSATVTGLADTRLAWSAEGGSIDAQGLFTAGTKPGAYLVSAQSLAEPTLCAKAFVTITAPVIGVAITPPAPYLTVGHSTTLTAQVTGTSNTTVTWSASIGSISANGAFTAPATAGTATITATSVADPQVSATTSIQVVAAPAASLVPSAASPLYGATNITLTPAFTGVSAVIGTSQGASNLSASAMAGTPIPVQSSGYRTATTYWIRATNLAGDFADASLALAPQAVAVGPISPTFVTVGLSAPFSATVTGGALGTVTWSASGGSWSGNQWTAPATAGPYTITATSVDDPTKSSSATVTVVAAPAILSFTLTLSAASANWVLLANYTGGTGTVDQGVGALADQTPLSVGTTHADLYTLTVTNAAGTSVTRTASAVAIALSDTMQNPSTLLPGQTLTVGVIVSGATNTAVTYQTDSGTINAAGLFTAPMNIQASLVTITSVADPTVQITLTVNTVPLIYPQNQVVAPGGSYAFTAPMLGIANKAVTWSLTNTNIGSISTNGVFTSNGNTGSGFIHATSVADPTLVGTGSVTVMPGFAYANTFTPDSGAMNARRTHHTLTRTYFNDVALAIGGISGGAPTGVMETYYQRNWTLKTTTLATPRSRHTATLLPTGLILIAGGRDAAGNPLASAELYDPHLDVMAAAPGAMAMAREDHTATLMPDGRVLIAGGQGSAGVLASAEIYDPATHTFTLVASAMQTPRVGHAAVALLDGRVLVAGGSTNGTDSTLTATADLFNPTTGSFTATANNMDWPRRNMGAALAPADGRVSLLGGVFTPSVPIVSAAGQHFNPATNTFSSFTAPMSTGRNRPLFALLANSTMLALGGSSDLGSPASENGLTATGTFDVFNPATTVFPTSGATVPAGVDQLGGRCILLGDGTLLIVGNATDANGLPVGSVIFQ